jgi:hypothetical protein
VLLETQLGKSRLHKVRVLFDSGSSGSIIEVDFMKKLCVKNDKKTEWLTKVGTFHTSGKCKTNFILNEFCENKINEWTLHVNNTSSPHHYDNIVGHDLLSETRNNSQC